MSTIAQTEPSLAEMRERFYGPSTPQPQTNIEKYRARYNVALTTLVNLGKMANDPIFITDIATNSVCDVSGVGAARRLAELTHRISSQEDIDRFHADQKRRELECRATEMAQREREGKYSGPSVDMSPLVELLKQQQSGRDHQVTDQTQSAPQAKTPVTPPISVRGKEEKS